jgi:hypothetical protein
MDGMLETASSSQQLCADVAPTAWRLRARSFEQLLHPATDKGCTRVEVTDPRQPLNRRRHKRLSVREPRNALFSRSFGA